ncbi:outer membrane beta-barrel protein [Rickettsiella endosymbiont of Miltochrista miniata]|uniref:outer membrane beta-barrel protein n=1 Tax=Rickettsiella endosymbiont of Miltochrista miniata TaxID=3066239 RepID=UPI00313AFF8C
MFKKVLCTTVLGVSALTVMAANAAAPGVYVTGQLGYANTHMGSKTNFADINKNTPADFNFTANNAKDSNLANNGLAGRIALGYQFNQNFAVETGYLYLGSKKVDGTIAKDHRNDTLSLHQNAIDLVGKGIVPMSTNVNLYGKVGVAYLTTDVEGKIAGTDSKPEVTADLNKNANLNKHKFAPEVALGVSYDITPNVSVDTSWTHIQPLGSDKPGNIDFVAVGLGYNFG